MAAKKKEQHHNTKHQPAVEKVNTAPGCDLKSWGEYQVMKKVGEGSFGAIYIAVHLVSKKKVALKVENSKIAYPQLQYEYLLLRELRFGVGIPQVETYGHQKNYNLMTMDLLGPNLEDLLTYCNRSFSLKTILMIADQMLRRLEYIHIKGIIHRDMKPDNMLVGTKRSSGIIYLIDFGLAKYYCDQDRRHIPYKENKSLTGTARYASVYTHLGIEQSRRDDLESLGYILIYFFNGWLPWQGINAPTKKQRYQEISDKKLATPLDQLCKGIPAEFGAFLKYARSLRFFDKPDYSYLRKMFRDLFIREGYKFDCMYDWCVMNESPKEGEKISKGEKLKKKLIK
uniref:non-specific serine/threonine protein kinase n=1 Tax=Paramoeba aestuarina TaxID=180227 RepID=A0A7S4USZ4_9EUKA